jgi:hypothetical protein
VRRGRGARNGGMAVGVGGGLVAIILLGITVLDGVGGLEGLGDLGSLSGESVGSGTNDVPSTLWQDGVTGAEVNDSA